MMKKNEPLIKTERMLIQPMSDEEIEELIESSESDELGAAYGQMLSGCRDNPVTRPLSSRHFLWTPVMQNRHNGLPSGLVLF